MEINILDSDAQCNVELSANPAEPILYGSVTFTCTISDNVTYLTWRQTSSSLTEITIDYPSCKSADDQLDHSVYGCIDASHFTRTIRNITKTMINDKWQCSVVCKNLETKSNSIYVTPTGKLIINTIHPQFVNTEHLFAITQSLIF